MTWELLSNSSECYHGVNCFCKGQILRGEKRELWRQLLAGRAGYISYSIVVQSVRNSTLYLALWSSVECCVGTFIKLSQVTIPSPLTTIQSESSLMNSIYFWESLVYKIKLSFIFRPIVSTIFAEWGCGILSMVSTCIWLMCEIWILQPPSGHLC